MGLTETGYVRATYYDIVKAKELKAKELFGEDIETSEQTPLGKFIRINAFDQAKAEEEAELIYYSRFPNTASGVSLDRLCVFVGITRNPATAAQYSVEVNGTAGYTIPIGFEVGTSSGVKFYNLNETVIGEDGTCIITVECTEDYVGEIGNIDFNEINEVVNPEADVISVQGVAWQGGTNQPRGADEENDYSLRKRFEAAREGQGSCTSNAIKAALLRVEGVTSASVIANEEDTEDAEGRPPHCFECYISGGHNKRQEIAKTIFDKKPIGIKTHGVESEEFADENGTSHTINFSFTEDIKVAITLKIKVNATYSGDTGASEIKDNLSSSINALGVGESVILSALYGKIHAVTGVVDVQEITLIANGISCGSANVPIGAYQTASCAESDISIEVVA